jgi:hypothetical protein
MGGCNASGGLHASDGEIPVFLPARPSGEHHEPLLGMISGPAEPGELAGEAATLAVVTAAAGPVQEMAQVMVTVLAPQATHMSAETPGPWNSGEPVRQIAP